MFLGMMDQKNSLIKRITGNDKIDPGNLSFLESGWWVLHSAAITAVFLIGYKMSQRNKF